MKSLRQSFKFQRYLLYVRYFSTPQEFLLDKGFSNETAHAMLNEMAQSGMSISVATLKSFGDSGLKSLSESVEAAAKREKEAKEAAAAKVQEEQEKKVALGTFMHSFVLFLVFQQLSLNLVEFE